MSVDRDRVAARVPEPGVNLVGVNAPPYPDDACPLCGIHRRYAGNHKETCGDGYLKPGCFVEKGAA